MHCGLSYLLVSQAHFRLVQKYLLSCKAQNLFTVSCSKITIGLLELISMERFVGSVNWKVKSQVQTALEH